MAQVKDVVFDCQHPASLPRFWAEAIEGYTVACYDEAELARLRAMGVDDFEDDPGVLVGPEVPGGPRYVLAALAGEGTGIDTSERYDVAVAALDASRPAARWEPPAYRRRQTPMMMRRTSWAVLAAGIVVAVIGLLVPVSGTPGGSSAEVSCGTAGQAASGTVDDGEETIMTGPDTALTKSAFCASEAGDVLRPALAAAAVLIVLGAVGLATSFALGPRRRERHPMAAR